MYAFTNTTNNDLYRSNPFLVLFFVRAITDTRMESVVRIVLGVAKRGKGLFGLVT